MSSPTRDSGTIQSETVHGNIPTSEKDLSVSEDVQADDKTEVGNEGLFINEQN